MQYIRRRAAALAAGWRWCFVALIAASAAACAPPPADVLTFSGSVVGREGDVLRSQLDRFERATPGVSVEVRPTPDAADARHQLYVQWLNAHAPEPDVLQLDVVWTAEFAAAGWIASLDPYQPAVDEFFPPPWPPIAGTAASSPYRGSSTSACCIGGPISFRALLQASTT
jgi:ABC-type glycerol-3-phosphate transport system substrate-binding protein